MACTRRTKTLVSTCVILSGMTNIVCLLYVGWVTNYIANVYIKVPMPVPAKKLEGDRKGETLRIIERLDRLENVVNQHIQESPLKGDDNQLDRSFSDSSLFNHWGQDLGPESRRVALKMFQYYGYNGYLSDRLSMDRPIPDYRPEGCKNMSYPSNLPQVSIVFIFVNEALSVILRSIHSAMNRTPRHLLKEIILVDDNSDNDELKEKLQDFVKETNAKQPGFIKMVRHSKQEGLIRSRVSGWRAASAPVVALFDAHVEFNTGWAQPILQRIKEDRTRIISPSFDNIKYDTFEIEEYPLSAQGFDWELWCRYLNPPKSWWNLKNSSAPIRSPALIGCFVVDREYFAEIGLLDEGMEIYGGENVELGVRVWQCGGSVEVLPCARIAHIERAHKPYTEDLTAHVRRNALRVAEVWMDEFKSHVYMAWNIPQELRNSLKTDLCLDQGPDTDNIPILYLCHGMSPQNVYYTSTQQLFVGILSPTIDDDDNKCLVDVNGRPRLTECSYAVAKRMKLHWHFTQGGSIQNTKSKRCLELVKNNDNEFGYQLMLQKCTGQNWIITNMMPGSTL
ncbi:polypeptide N-acetylgalactosaminyltransferase 18-like [Sinocyclocheilus rhinocerous]|uniref:Polypeptide N-acetylgalactosaminyltransferase n=1 Tax=Sinocyclocheilus rhinocerous TaxID=307959 RepID=A0A673MZC8_9TELE|nr:PREDICTED: polypeptide N-acetylgalactosaminyltransferase 18-like [Sinocyclocheilus rhinocerous]